MAWLERADLAERPVWVTIFRDGDETIGEVIKNTMSRRGAHWDAPPSMTPYHQPRDPPNRQHQQSPHQQSPRSPQGKGGKQRKQESPSKTSRPQQGNSPSGSTAGNSKLTPGSVVRILNNGTALCPDFQRGECRNDGARCAKGLHKCGKVGPKGRICGMNFHGASKYRAK